MGPKAGHLNHTLFHHRPFLYLLGPWVRQSMKLGNSPTPEQCIPVAVLSQAWLLQWHELQGLSLGIGGDGIEEAGQ